MTRTIPFLACLLTLLAPASAAQDGAKDEAAPVLLRWERTLQDAEALSRETGRPILICVNTDGEAASERFASRIYTDEGFAELTHSYFPVILSPDRHNPRDFDRHGRRIPCPRFGRVTCGEHRAAEPLAFERYFKGRRVAPRHVGVSSSGEVLFDLFLLEGWELDRVDEALVEFTGDEQRRPKGEGPHARSADAREELESEWWEAGTGKRSSMLVEAGRSEVAQPGLMRMGLATGSVQDELAVARALIKTADEASTELVQMALRRNLPEELHVELARTLERVATSDDERRLLGDMKAVRAPSGRIVREVWLSGLEEAGQAPAADPVPDEELYKRIDALDEAHKASPDNGGLLLQIADAWYDLGLRAMQRTTDPTFYYMDARSSAEEALAKGAEEIAVRSLLARAEWRLGNREEAAQHAEEALIHSSESAASPQSAEVLGIFAMARTSEIYAKRSIEAEFPAEWLTDAHAAYGILARHPLGTVDHARSHADLLLYLGLVRDAELALRHALQRFPESAALHERFRTVVKSASGDTALGAAYATLEEELPAGAAFEWFAGYASLLEAEELQRGAEPTAADQAYKRSLARFDASQEANPEYADTADHYSVFALAGRARSAFDAGDLEAAAHFIALAISRRPDTADLPDGLQRTPVDMLRRIRRAVESAGRDDLQAELAESIATTAPEAWSKSEA